MRNILMVLIVVFLSTAAAKSQEVGDSHLRYSLTVEPFNFIASGYSFWGGIRYKKFELGVATFSITTETNALFQNGDQLDIQLRNGTALYTRFYPLKKKSGPFMGFLLGYEAWRIRGKKEPIEENIYRNAFFTPQVGYQWLTLKGRLIVNPNVRMILPFAASGPEATNGISNDLNNFGIIPALDIGIRFGKM